MRAFELRHVVSFEETNLVGNVYYANHLRWQGRCRELFLRQHCPDILEELGTDLVLSTTRCACDYFAELTAFDEIVVRMTLRSMAQNRLELAFEYLRVADGESLLVARGEQRIACMRRRDGSLEATPVPESLRRALELYADDSR